MTGLATALVITAAIWPVALGAALADRIDGRPTVGSQLVYLAASRVCHQRPDRSFHTRGHAWPVCARCAGLYLAAPLGCVLAVIGRRSVRVQPARVLLLAASPIALTWGIEVTGAAAVGALTRCVTAMPFGVAAAWALVTLAGRPNRIG